MDNPGVKQDDKKSKIKPKATKWSKPALDINLMLDAPIALQAHLINNWIDGKGKDKVQKVLNNIRNLSGIDTPNEIPESKITSKEWKKDQKIFKEVLDSLFYGYKKIDVTGIAFGGMEDPVNFGGQTLFGTEYTAGENEEGKTEQLLDKFGKKYAKKTYGKDEEGKDNTTALSEHRNNLQVAVRNNSPYYNIQAIFNQVKELDAGSRADEIVGIFAQLAHIYNQASGKDADITRALVSLYTQKLQEHMQVAASADINIDTDKRTEARDTIKDMFRTTMKEVGGKKEKPLSFVERFEMREAMRKQLKKGDDLLTPIRLLYALDIEDYAYIVSERETLGGFGYQLKKFLIKTIEFLTGSLKTNKVMSEKLGIAVEVLNEYLNNDVREMAEAEKQEMKENVEGFGKTAGDGVESD